VEEKYEENAVEINCGLFVDLNLIYRYFLDMQKLVLVVAKNV